MLADYHVHTYYSDDSAYPMEDCVKDAIAKGIEELCFTEHADYGIKYDWDDVKEPVYREVAPGRKELLMNCDYKKYFREIAYLKKKYEGKITIHQGMEFGMQRHTIDRYQKLFDTYPFDFIILSVHEVGDKEFWNNEFQKGRTQEEYNLAYYDELLYLVQHYHDYSILGHLDLITRYDPEGKIDFSIIEPIVTEILKTVIADGKGIEFNTSYHRYGLSCTTPCTEILSLYKDLGGTIITIGSDSHKKEHLSAYIDEAKSILKALGYSSFYTYEAMKPIEHQL